MNRPLETERLDLRPFAADEVDAWHSIWGDPEVIWWGANGSRERSREQLERLVAAEKTWPDGIGWLAVRERGREEVIGDVLLQPARFVDGIEIGWHFRKASWGRGYATEAARAVLRRCLAERVCDAVYAIVATSNARSLRVVRRLGMRAERDMEYAGLPHRLFSACAAGERVEVECYSGYRGEEEPRRLRRSGASIELAEIVERWQEPGRRFFRVRGDDGREYLLCHDADAGWSLAPRRS